MAFAILRKLHMDHHAPLAPYAVREYGYGQQCSPGDPSEAPAKWQRPHDPAAIEFFCNVDAGRNYVEKQQHYLRRITPAAPANPWFLDASPYCAYIQDM
jgi:hypothetical protein